MIQHYIPTFKNKPWEPILLHLAVFESGSSQNVVMYIHNKHPVSWALMQC